MEDKSKYFVVKQKAVPEVLQKVVEAKRLLETERAITVQEATDRVGISRSSFYKYRDDIFPFTTTLKEKLSLWSSRWKTSRDFWRRSFRS